MIRWTASEFRKTGAALVWRSDAGRLPTRPTVLFVLAGDMGWGDLSCYGDPRLKTLNLDRAAWQGTLSTSSMADDAMDFIRQGTRERPFYAQVWILLPHAPLSPTAGQPAGFARLLPGPDVPWPGAARQHSDLKGQDGRHIGNS